MKNNEVFFVKKSFLLIKQIHNAFFQLIFLPIVYTFLGKLEAYLAILNELQLWSFKLYNLSDYFEDISKVTFHAFHAASVICDAN